jgi:hypothetical protein
MVFKLENLVSLGGEAKGGVSLRLFGYILPDGDSLDDITSDDYFNGASSFLLVNDTILLQYTDTETQNKTISIGIVKQAWVNHILVTLTSSQNVPPATINQAGIIQIATQDDIDKGTDNSKAITSLLIDNLLKPFNVTLDNIQQQLANLQDKEQTDINTEIQARQTDDDILQVNIDNEANVREQAQEILQQNIDSEASARTLDTSAIRVDVANETTRATLKELELTNKTTQLSSDLTTAKQDILTNTQDIAKNTTDIDTNKFEIEANIHAIEDINKIIPVYTLQSTLIFADSNIEEPTTITKTQTYTIPDGVLDSGNNYKVSVKERLIEKTTIDDGKRYGFKNNDIDVLVQYSNITNTTTISITYIIKYYVAKDYTDEIWTAGLEIDILND